MNKDLNKANKVRNVIGYIIIIIIFHSSPIYSQFNSDSTQAKKSIQIKAERDSLRVVVKYFEFENSMQDTIIQAQDAKIVSKDKELRLVYDMKNLLQERVDFLEKQPKEIKQENKYSFLEIFGYTAIITVISFIAGVLSF